MSKLKTDKHSPEGAEGFVIEIKNNNIVHDNITRCTNQECSIKEECKRYIQFEIDKTYNISSPYFYAEFTNIPAYTADNPQESYDAKKNCGKFIQN